MTRRSKKCFWCSTRNCPWAYLEEGDEVGLWGGLQLSLQPSSELLRLDLCILKTHARTHSSCSQRGAESDGEEVRGHLTSRS